MHNCIKIKKNQTLGVSYILVLLLKTEIFSVYSAWILINDRPRHSQELPLSVHNRETIDWLHASHLPKLEFEEAGRHAVEP